MEAEAWGTLTANCSQDQYHGRTAAWGVSAMRQSRAPIGSGRGQHVNLQDIAGMRFAGRSTRVVVAPGGPLEAAGFSLGRSRLDPGGDIPAHQHPNEEVYHVIAGTGRLRIGEEVFTARAGDFFRIPPGVEHQLRCDDEGCMELLWVYCPAGIVAHWAEERAQLPRTEEVCPHE